MLTGRSPGMNAIIHIDWYMLTYYQHEDNSYPLEPTKQFGHFVGISEHIGHTLMYKLRTENSQKIIYRSMICSAINPNPRKIKATDNVKLIQAAI